VAQGRKGPQDAGIANQNVELTPALIDGRTEPVDLVVLLEIEREQGGAATGLAHLIVDFFQGARGASNEDQVCAFSGVGEGDRPTDPAGGSGDEGKAPSKTWVRVHGHRVSPEVLALASGSGI